MLMAGVRLLLRHQPIARSSGSLEGLRAKVGPLSEFSLEVQPCISSQAWLPYRVGRGAGDDMIAKSNFAESLVISPKQEGAPVRVPRNSVT